MLPGNQVSAGYRAPGHVRRKFIVGRVANHEVAADQRRVIQPWAANRPAAAMVVLPTDEGTALIIDDHSRPCQMETTAIQIAVAIQYVDIYQSWICWRFLLFTRKRSLSESPQQVKCAEIEKDQSDIDSPATK
jgi:hypothetical protein